MKKELRRKILSQRAALSPEEIAQKSEAIAAKVLALPFYQEAKVIMVYLSFRQEVETRPIIEHALAAGKRIVAPVTDRVQKKLIPLEIKNYPHDLAPGAWGILEPKLYCPSVNPREIDLVLVPGVAFDQAGNRLGYGGGFYDRFLKDLREGAITIALAYSFQVKGRIPAEKNDLPVACVVTEKETILCKNSKEVLEDGRSSRGSPGKSQEAGGGSC